MDEECIHGLDPSWCDLCLTPRKSRRPILDAITEKPKAKIRAHYDGFCLRCEEPIEAGEQIGLDEHFGWIHISHFDLSGW